MAKQNCREEINRINKKTNIKVACMKRELKFWQIISVGTVVMGMLLGWMLCSSDSSYQGRKKMHARKNLLGKPTTPDLLNDRFVNGINA